MRNLLTTLTLLIPLSSLASDLGIITTSYHLQHIENANQQNIGAYLRTTNYIIGGYKNTFYNNTFFAGKIFHHNINKSIKLEFVTGAVYGYAWHNGLADSKVYGNQILPFVSPSISFNIQQNTSINLSLIGSAVGLSFSYQL